MTTDRQSKPKTKRVLRNVLLGLGGALGLLAVVIATRPATFHVERSTTIAAPPENAFVLVNDFHAWKTWSPFENLDPEMKRTYEGPASGVGARYGWTGDKSGAGTMTIEKSERPSQIAIKLEFTAPMKATNTATFSFVPAAGGTKVTWAMDGENSFVGKAFSLVCDFDKMIGGDFERGLAAMKESAEKAAKTSAVR